MDEDTKIDVNAPLLSIRRFSVEPPTSSPSTTTSSANSNSNSTKNLTNKSRRSSLPFYKPDIKSGPIRNPGVIPFVWEQRPGQPKPGNNGNGSSSPSRPVYVAPKPPPVKMGSSVRTRKPVTELSSPVKEVKDSYFEDCNYGNNEGLEDEKQEKVKEGGKFDKQPPHVVPESVKDKPRGVTNNENYEPRVTEKVKQTKKEDNVEIEKKEQENKQKEMRDKDGEEDEDDDFSDALDTLSRTESTFMNCSVSGLSELPAGPTKQSALSGGSDPDAREFMIGRFLPAAQAVATGSPQYTFRKAPAPARDLAERARPIIGRGITPSQRRVPVPLPYQHQPRYENNFLDEEEDEDEEEDDEDFEESGRFYAKGCGFLPSFCIKSSMLMMNPVPGMKGRGKAVQPRGGAGRRARSPLIRSSNNGSDSKRSDDAFENYMHSWEPVYKHKQDHNSNSSMKLNGSSKNINSETSHLTYWSDSPNTGGGSSPFIHSTGEAISPPFPASNGDDQSSKDSRLNSLEKIEYKSSPAVASHCSSQNRSSFLDRDPDQFLDAQESNPSESASVTEEVEKVIEVHVPPSKIDSTKERETAVKKNGVVKRNGVDQVLPAQLLPLPLPKSPTESWLSRTLPAVSVKKQPMPSFLGMQVQNKNQGFRENEIKPSGPHLIRFCEVLEKPASVQSEI